MHARAVLALIPLLLPACGIVGPGGLLGSNDSGEMCICCDTPWYFGTCEEELQSGPWGAPLDPWLRGEPASADGVVVTNTPPSRDAGLAELIAAMPESGELTGSWTVTGAVVINVNSAPARAAWLQDAHEAVRLALAVDLVPPAALGQVVSFTATSLSVVGGDLRVTALDGWTVGPDTAPVPVTSAQHRALTAADRGRNVEVYGPITEGSVTDPVYYEHVSRGDNATPVLIEEGVTVPWWVCVGIVAPVTHQVGDGVDLYAIDLATPRWIEANPDDDVDQPSLCE